VNEFESKLYLRK